MCSNHLNELIISAHFMLICIMVRVGLEVREGWGANNDTKWSSPFSDRHLKHFYFTRYIDAITEGWVCGLHGTVTRIDILVRLYFNSYLSQHKKIAISRAF